MNQINRLSLLLNTSQPEWYQWMVRHFYYLHQHPELSFEEENTIKYIAKVLEDDLDLTPNFFSVNGEIYGKLVSSQAIAVSFGQGEKTVIFTGDFDALPVEENSTLWYRSKQNDKMHACGHDLHTSILLGLGWWLKQHESSLNCRVVLLFRPAEEQNGAAFLIKSEEFLEYIGSKAICLSLHVYPELPAGQIATCPGLINYSAELVSVHIKGKGGHTARPEHENSSLNVLGKILTELPLRIKAEVPEAIVAFGQAHGGSKGNIIPETVWCEGTLRAPDFQIHNRANNSIIEYLKPLENEFVKISYKNSGVPAFPPTYNDDTLVEKSLSVTEHFPWIQVKITESSRGADDVSWFSEKGYPTHFFRLGTKPEHQTQIYDLHSPKFEADPRALMAGVYYQVYQLIQFMES